MRWSQAAADQEIYHNTVRDVQEEAKGFNVLATSSAGTVG